MRLRGFGAAAGLKDKSVSDAADRSGLALTPTAPQGFPPAVAELQGAVHGGTSARALDGKLQAAAAARARCLRCRRR